MNKVRVLAPTSGRADYSIVYPMLRALQQDDQFDLEVVALGTHVSNHFAHTIDQVHADGFEVLPLSSIILGEGPEATATGIGTTALKFSSLWALKQPDAILCVGDRFEIFAAVMSSIPFKIPIIHFHGGETTLGSLDEVYRTAITAASTLHFCSSEPYVERVREILGMAEGREVRAVGALGIDTIRQTPRMSPEEFDQRFGTRIVEPTLLFTFHPVTEDPAEGIEPCLAAMAELPCRKLVTMPNADHGGGEIRRLIQSHFGADPLVTLQETLGRTGFYSALELCTFVLGNSSAGIVESGYFGIPVVNVGSRQKGRLRPGNVIDCANNLPSVRRAIQQAQQTARVADTSVYGNGTAASQALAHIKAYFNAR